MSPAEAAPAASRLAERFDLSNDDIREQAQKAASSVRRLADLWERNGTDPAAVLRSLRTIAKRHCIRLPNKRSLAERVNRMCDAGWWRRSLRYRFKAVELQAIKRGAVHAKASPYVSDKTLRRHERHAARLVEQMAGLEAVNQTTGEVQDMTSLIERSLSNPVKRRIAMMVRIKGIEASANARGHVGLFFTITCPSRMHPRRSDTGAPNPRYDSRWFPTRANRYLCRVWSNAMRAATHQGLSPYGLRVVEPHHDACPHWHVLTFIPADQADAFTTLVRKYALRDSPNEPGAQKRRLEVVPIDPAQGSALSYVAKYVSKGIDGEGVDADSESAETGSSAARRLIAWMRMWDIRQFQFYGVPAITPTREFFRVAGDTLPGEALPALHAACKANDYASWLAMVDAHGLRFGVDYLERPSSRYRGETSKAIQGVRVDGGDLGGTLQITTRCDTWRIEPRPKTSVGNAAGVSGSEGLGPSWTRINNSAPVDFKELFPGALPEEIEVWGDAGAAEEASRTGHRYPVQDKAIGDQPARSVAPPTDDARTSAEGRA